MSDVYYLEPSNTVRLPIGFYKDGQFYKEVIIDDWRHIDNEVLTSPSARNNTAKAASRVLARLIQEIPGAMDRKSNSVHLCADRWVENMFQSDRDAVLMQAFLLAGASDDEDERGTLPVVCTNPRCGEELDDDVDLGQLPVTSYDGEDPFVYISLPKGVSMVVRDLETNEMNKILSKEGKFRFPTGKDMHKISRSSSKGDMEALTAILATCLYDMEGLGRNGGLGKPGKAQIQNLYQADIKYLKSIIEDQIPGVDTRKTTDCPYCGKEFEYNVDIGGYFLSTLSSK